MGSYRVKANISMICFIFIALPALALPPFNAPAHTSPNGDGHIIQQGSEKKFGVGGLTELDIKIIGLARDEIYARHGIASRHEIASKQNNCFMGKMPRKDGGAPENSRPRAEMANIPLEEITREARKLRNMEPAKNAIVPVNKPKSDGAANANAKKGELIVATARTQIGKPYKHASSDPSKGFDCSGLVNWVYRQHGVNTPLSTPDLLKIGASVPPNQLKPGDIVITKNRVGVDSTHGFHAGIYVGNGVMIHAPGKTRRVIAAEMTYFNVKEGRRVF
ncbi:MAG: C40 family peptidase [Synergistaceae bacterium]|nr:C40 family peptidase [Synergistaceae bacterium]